MTGLPEFLSARLDDDEAVARALMDWHEAPRDRSLPWTRTSSDHRLVGWGLTFIAAGVTDEVATHIARHDPARVLADVEAKRKIVALAVTLQQHTDMGSATDEYGDELLCLLALPFADHPDYDERWRA